MNSKTLKALIEAGAVKSSEIVADGSKIHVRIVTNKNEPIIIQTTKGAVKTWSTIDAASKWLRGLGLGKMSLDVSRWTPAQRSIV